ncbi:cytochrome c553 [Bradyrhizobium yuanmingense]|uniref:HNH endonuclease n=1 Tax=Bradyrhizobium yuanmingense TaxID=108015 RepID=UPI003512858C
MDEDSLTPGDFYEGVLLETCRDENRSITRPRVRPLEYFPSWMRVEFPRTLREKYPIGTRFRADVTVGQKHWSNGIAKGPPYLAARPSSIVRDTSYTPEVKLMAVPKPGTISGRAHDYELVAIEQSAAPTILELREQAYEMADISPPQARREVWQRTRSAIIAQYALCRSRGNCEACKRPAPFMRRNDQPYLEVHHVRALANGGADHPLNVAAVCPNCHSRVTHGKDAEAYNALIAQSVKEIEGRLEREA